MSASRVLDARALPIIGAPMAGGPSTPALAAAVSSAGGLGFLAGGYLSAEQVGAQIRETRALTDEPIGLNVFSAETWAPPAADIARYARALAPWARRVGCAPPQPVTVDAAAERAEADAIVRVAIGERVAMVTFTFGPPTPSQVSALRAAGIEVGITVAGAPDARAALALEPQVLIVQGPESGGHRSTADQRDAGDPRPLTVLLADVRALVGSDGRAPALIAAGGAGDREDVRRLIAAGADAVQVGTALLLTPEAGTKDAHRRALETSRGSGDGAAAEASGGHSTATTRVFSGRVARGLVNEAMRSLEADAVIGYPHVHRMTAPLRAASAADGEWTSLWAGTGHRKVRAEPAGDVVRRLAP